MKIETIFNVTENRIEEHEVDELTGITKDIDLSGDTTYCEVINGKIVIY